MKLSAHTDGASKSNPGPAAIGYTIEKANVILEEFYDYIGDATNNTAEYRACIAALNRMKELGATDIDLYSDSELIVRQINGLYRVKNPGLKFLYTQVMTLLNCFNSYNIIHIPRENNIHADNLANKAIKEYKKKKKSTN